MLFRLLGGASGFLCYINNLTAFVHAAVGTGAVWQEWLLALRAELNCLWSQGKMRGAATFVGRSAAMTGKTHIILGIRS